MNRSLKIIGSSFIETFKWSKWKWIFGTSLSALFGILFIGEKFGLNAIDLLFVALFVITIIFVLRWFIITTINTFKFLHEVYKNSTYGDAIIILKDCFAEIHYYRKTNGFDEEEFMKSMILFCNNLKIIFDNITKSNCSVSIKVPVSHEKVNTDTSLRNLTRDTSHKDRDTKQYMGVSHTIIGNTAFINTLNQVITNNADKFYINNSVNNTPNYMNTSQQCYDNGKLPYNSEIVHSISPKKTINPKSLECHGFLYIDSDIENAFNNKYCSAIVEGVCDGIYDLILELNKNKDVNTKN